MKLLSLDVPWGRAGYVGAAFADVQAGGLRRGPLVAATAARRAPAAPRFPAADPEIAGAIENGVGEGRVRPQDLEGVAFAHLPTSPATRAACLRTWWNAFCLIRARLALPGLALDVVLVDIPLVPGQLARQPIDAGTRSRRRPVELAFEKKVRIEGRGPLEERKLISLGVFQSGNVNRWRPGYAIARLAAFCFQAETVVESFPQLTLGALGEVAGARAGVRRISSLAAHKKGRARAAHQEVLDEQIQMIIPQGLNWVDPEPGTTARADGYDAILGLLPALIYAGYRVPRAPEPPLFRTAVLLRNLTGDLPPLPAIVRPGRHAVHTRAWKLDVTAREPQQGLRPGVDDRGILAVDLGLWQ